MITIPLIKEKIEQSTQAKPTANQLKYAQEIAAMQDHPLWQQFINQPVSRGTKKSKQKNISK